MSEDGKYLIAISDDGTVSAYNCKRHMFLMESESMGTDLCSIATVKGETKTLVTTSSGQIQVYNYKGWGHPSDIIPGHGFHKNLNAKKSRHETFEILFKDLKSEICAARN